MPAVSCALLSLETARRGVSSGAANAALVLAGVALLSMVASTTPTVFVTSVAVTLGAGIVLGALLRRTGNLAFAFQAAVLLALLLVAALSLLGSPSSTLIAAALKEFADLLREGGTPNEEVEAFIARSGVMLLAGAVFLQLIGALLLSYWWVTLVRGELTFGAEFRQLTVGRALGAILTLLLLLGLVFAAPLVQNLAPLALLAFMLQGLAVLSAAAHAQGWRTAVLVPVYVVAALLAVFVALPLCLLGLVDNWFDLRSRLRPRS